MTKTKILDDGFDTIILSPNGSNYDILGTKKGQKARHIIHKNICLEEASLLSLEYLKQIKIKGE